MKTLQTRWICRSFFINIMKQTIQAFLAGLILLIMIPCVTLGFFYKQIKTGFVA